jgi:large subunit ribosomal protein L16
MLSPAKSKYRKHQKGKMKGIASRGHDVSFGDYGIVSTQCGWITARQIEAGRIAISRHLKKAGKLWIRMFPDKPITKKPIETRMGKGKGNVEEWVCVVKPGRVLYEVHGVSEDLAREALRRASRKLPVITRFVSRNATL